MKTNCFADIAREFQLCCQEVRETDSERVLDVTPLIQSLRHLKVDDGYSIKCRVPAKDAHYGVSTIFACKDSSSETDECWTKHISIEISEIGVWEGFIAGEAYKFLPLSGTGLSLRNKYILDADSLIEMLGFPEEYSYLAGDGLTGLSKKTLKTLGILHHQDFLNAYNLCGDTMLLPSVRVEDGRFEITYSYVNFNGELVRERILPIIESNHITSFQYKRVNLVNRRITRPFCR